MSCLRLCPQVTTDNLPGTSSVVSAASTFLTCIAQDAVGIILIALDDSQTPFAYNWVEGVDVRTSDGQIVPPVASPDDVNMAERQLLEDDALLGPFGGCYALAGDLQMQLSPRTFCSSNEGSGLFEIRLPIEMGYCESSWATIDLQNDDGTVRAVSCKRFAPICPECAQTSNKPLLAYVADSDVTNRNDGLNCDQTLFDPPPFTVPSLAPSSVPTSTPSVSPTLNPTSVPTQAPFPIPTPAPSPEPTKDKPKCKGFYKKKDKNRYCWDHKNLFHRPYTKIGGGITEIKLYGRHSSTSSWHWWGVLEMPRSGKLKFRTTSADGSQVWLFNEGEGHDGERPDTNGAALIVDNTRYRKWGVSKSVASDWIHVKKGEKRVMHVFYGQKRRRTRMVLRWKFQHAWYKTDMKPFFPCSDD